MADKYAEEHKVNTNLPLQCQVQQVVARLSRLKHDGFKSTIALNVWIEKRNLPEIKQETFELQQTIQTELNYAIHHLNTLKSEITTLQTQLREEKGKNKKLNEQISALHKQVADLSFEDIDYIVSEQPKQPTKEQNEHVQIDRRLKEPESKERSSCTSQIDQNENLQDCQEIQMKDTST
uniref:Uncharacterized protein LOC111110629 n=1 Tax=Crassostrea virginica TaxID=6565 RepID=A0A8B8BIY4_CRAVI|nr:uncharacterized protein LOC111110629 [Crassostrea virginica]